MTLLLRLAPLAVVSILAAAAAETGSADFEKSLRPVLAEHCFRCHGGTKHKGDVDLERFRTLEDVAASPQAWEDALRMVREGDMPPKKEAQPDPDVRTRLVEGLDRLLDAISATAPRDPGHVVLHRLSHAEYDNTIRDLLGVELRAADGFPGDGGGSSGFDNDADALLTSGLLVEKLLDAAQAALEAAKPERLFIARPAEDKPKARREAARIVIAGFARHAFRRPVSGAEVERYLRLFDGCDKRGLGFEDAIRQSAKAILVSPDFLFRTESARPGRQSYEVGQYELANRLSYFLWSSMPDEPLFALAEARSLSDPDILVQQVRRMLADPKASALARSFAPQWLQIGELLQTQKGPDPSAFPQFTPALREAMMAEPIALVDAVLRSDRPLLDLVASRSTFVNQDLAALYGIDGVTGPAMREVLLPDAIRGGVIGMAAVLTATSRPRRTSPVLRGKWILEVLFDAKPPPAPPNVPPFPKEEAGKAPVTIRQRLEAHRADPACASCHSHIDPLGFGLEQFDPIGRWRPADAHGLPIDAVGELSTGERFDGPAELRAVLVKRKDRFLRAVAAKLLTYALGRSLAFADRPALHGILDAMHQGGDRGTALVIAIAQSYPFTHTRDQPLAASLPDPGTAPQTATR
jgi:hypothetical protein